MDYPWYIVDDRFHKDPKLYQTFKRPDTMTEAHKAVRKYFSENGKRSKRIIDGKPGPWLLSGALTRFENGAKLGSGDAEHTN